MNLNQVKVSLVKPCRNAFIKEARRIQERALRGETAVVHLGPVIFFCANQDAWMLDPEDHFARCLAREGPKLPVGIFETKTQLRIEWNADYSIEGEVFTVSERDSGELRRITGYPTREIESPLRS